jgi:hypothetical protein
MIAARVGSIRARRYSPRRMSTAIDAAGLEAVRADVRELLDGTPQRRARVRMWRWSSSLRSA